MHPEVETSLRNLADSFVANVRSESHLYFLSMDSGYISQDDLYFLGIVNASHSIAMDNIVEIEDVPTIGEMPLLNKVKPEFNRDVYVEQFDLVSEIYNCNPFEAEDRYEKIMRDISRYEFEMNELND